MRHVLVALCLFSAACSGSPTTNPKGDAGPTGDAGHASDAGHTVDAGHPHDAGHGTDSGHVVDSGRTVDATPGDGGTGGLLGTWDLSTTPVGGSVVMTTVVVGEDSLSVTSPSFTLTASRSGNVLSFVDKDGVPAAIFGGTETAGTFDPGLVPFTLGGSWALQGGDQGGASTMQCTLQVSATEIDATCNDLGPTSPFFTFTSTKGPAAASSFGDFGGTWNNVWTWGKAGSKTYPCALDFAGNDINTCAGGAVGGKVTGSPLAGITFTWDGANTISGGAMGWAEFSATRH